MFLGPFLLGTGEDYFHYLAESDVMRLNIQQTEHVYCEFILLISFVLEYNALWKTKALHVGSKY